MSKTLDELRKTPKHVVCEHGCSQRSCDACECLALTDENERLKARVAELEKTNESISSALRAIGVTTEIVALISTPPRNVYRDEGK